MSSLRSRAQRVRRVVRRQVLARRRLLAALCSAGAVAAGLHAVAAPPPATVAVLTAAHDLPAGTVLHADDLGSVAFAAGSVPDGLAGDAVGRTLASPVRAGEPITDVRLVGAGLADAHPELTAMPIRLPDPGGVALLDPGDRIDLLATDPQAGGSRVVATGALVLAVPSTSSTADPASPGGALVLVGVLPSSVTLLSEASARWFLTFAFSR
jgi:Flp pilus assembly protein CpaB